MMLKQYEAQSEDLRSKGTQYRNSICQKYISRAWFGASLFGSSQSAQAVVGLGSAKDVYTGCGCYVGLAGLS